MVQGLIYEEGVRRTSSDSILHLLIKDDVIDLIPVVVQNVETHIRVKHDVPIDMSIGVDFPRWPFWLVEIGVQVAIYNNGGVCRDMTAYPVRGTRACLCIGCILRH